MSINFKKARKKLLSTQRQGEFVRITFPGVDQEAYLNQVYPIVIPFVDRLGNTHSLRYQNDYMEIDNVLTPVSSVLELMYGINAADGFAAAEAYETGFIRTIGFVDPRDLEHTDFAGGYTSERVARYGNPEHGQLQYHSLSPAKYPIATRDVVITDIGIRWESHGVFRIHPSVFFSPKKAVLITEDPLAADYFCEQGIKAIALPSQKELTYYDYPTLLGGAAVYILCAHEGITFEYSIFPFTELCLKAGLNVQRVNTSGAFGYSSAVDYLSKHGIKAFEEKIRSYSSPIYASDVPSKKSYNFARSRRIPSIDPAQSVEGHRFFYSIGNTGDILVSNPVRVLPSTKLTTYEQVEPRHFSPFETVCTPEVFEHIQNGQFMGLEDLFTSTLDFIKRYIYLKEESWYVVLTLWIIGTYFYKAFPAYPYLNFEGIRGSGKTTILDVIAALSFNGVVKTKATVASMTELVDQKCATLCVDEFEDFSSSKNTHDDLSRFLNGGYNYKGTYTKKVGKSSQTFHTYSPKAFGGTGGINLDTLSSRTIPIPMKEKPKNIELEGFMDFDPKVLQQQELTRTAALAFPLLNTVTLLEASKSLPSDLTLPLSGKKLGNRQFQLAKPLLVIGKLVDVSSSSNTNIQKMVLEGLDSLWNYSLAQKMNEQRVFVKVLQDWSKDSNFDAYVIDGDYCWFPKDIWEDTPLRKHYPNNNQLYKWLRTLGSIKSKSHHFPHLPKDEKGKQSMSGVGIALNLTIMHQPFRNWFTKK